MDRFLARFSDLAYAVFRIVVGALWLQHGLGKIFGLLGGFDGKHPGETLPVGGQFWIGGVIEFACGTLVAIGLFSGWAAFLACGTMAVAYFQVHQPQGTLPLQNGGELAVLYCFAFLLIATKGNGKLSAGGERKPS